MPFGVSDLGFGVSFTLEDGFSNVAKKIEDSFKSFGGSVDSTIGNIGNKLSSLNTIGNAILSGGFLVGLNKATMMAADMSDILADVTKTTGLAGDALIDYRNKLDSLQTRTSIEDLIGISVVGGKMGIAKENLLSFTEAVDKAVVALGDDFSGGAEEVAKRLSIINNLFKETKSLEIGDSLTKIGSTLNALGNAGSNSALNVSEFTNRIGQLGALAPSITQTMGLGAALQEVGINAEVASGGVTNLIVTATTRMGEFSKQMGLSTTQATNLINTDVNGFLLKLGESFKGMSNVDVGVKLKELGVGSQEATKVMLQLSNNIDLVRERQKLANESFSEGTSLMEEFNAKNATLAASFDIFGKKTDSIWVRIGEVMKPFVQYALSILVDLLDGFRKLIETPIGKFFVGLTVAALTALSFIVLLGTAIPFVTSAFTALGISISVAIWPITLITAGIVALSYVLYKVYDAITTGTERVATFGVVLGFLLGPIGWVVAGFAMIKRGFDEFNTLADGGEAKKGIFGFLQKVGGVLTGVMEIWGSATNEGFSLSERTKNALDKIGILKLVVALGTYIVRVKEFFSGIWEGIKEGFLKPFGEAIGAIGDAFGGLMDVVSSIFDLFGIDIENATGSLEAFASVGKFIGKTISYALMPIVWVLKGISDDLEYVNSLFGDTNDKVQEISKKGIPNGKVSIDGDITGELKKSNETAIQEKESARQKAGNTTVNVVAPDQNKNQTITTIIELDGERIAKAVNDVNKFAGEIN